MFKPTKFYWRKTPKVPDLFSYQPNENIDHDSPEINIAPLKRKRVGEYVASIHTSKEGSDPDLQKANSVLEYFNQSGVEPIVPIPQKPTAGLNSSTSSNLFDQSINSLSAKNGETSVWKSSQPQTSSVSVRPSQILTFTPKGNEKESTQNQRSANEQTNPRVFFDAQAQDKKAMQLTPTPTTTTQPIEGELGVGIFNTKLPFPQNPTQPNLLVGMVLNQQEEMIPGAILEIKNQGGHVERAVKSNALGQFFVTTPLKPGAYTISTEADGYLFEPFSFTTNNTILPPLEVRSVS